VLTNWGFRHNFGKVSGIDDVHWVLELACYNIIMRKIVLGSPIDLLTRAETLDLIARWLKQDQVMKLVVTAYSEFYVRALADPDFRKALNKADLVTPDGVSVLAAVEYEERTQGIKNSRNQDHACRQAGLKNSRTQDNVIRQIWEGLKVGGKIISGKIGETVTGVWLFEELVKMAEKEGKKIFLLGGWQNVSGRTATMLLKRFPKLKIAYDEGEERVGTDEKKNQQVIDKINQFAPDILFVAYNPVKQEKWLAKYRGQLKAKVGIGVGGTFDEYAGEFRKAPRWMEKAGLKWLWRVIQEPKRLGRILRAVIIFPWLVFRDSLSNN
jgi:exopolysaccharide biosynthesis WecB/TagA/CpsF family protein